MLDNILSTSCTALGELVRSQGAHANMYHRFQTRQVPSHPRPPWQEQCGCVRFPLRKLRKLWKCLDLLLL